MGFAGTAKDPDLATPTDVSPPRALAAPPLSDQAFSHCFNRVRSFFIASTIAGPWPTGYS